ncbi:CRISPR-associated endoribonuclease Cas6 [Thermovibrio ammonificans]
MRLKIVFRTDRVPILYRHRVVSLVKEALKRGNGELYEKLYGSQNPKPFTFSLFFNPPYRVEKLPLQIDETFTPERFKELRQVETFTLESGTFSVNISTPDYLFAVSLVNGLVSLKEFLFSTEKEMLVGGKRVIWELLKITPYRSRPVKKGEAVVKTLSPIVVEDKRGKPVLWNSPDFQEALNFVTDRRLKELRGKGLKREISVTPVKCEKKVAKATFKEFRERTGKPYMVLTGSYGIFKLNGDSEDLNFLCDAGLGNRCSQGFGMVEVIK